MEWPRARSLRRGAAAVAFLTIGIALAGCGSGSPSASSSGGAPPPDPPDQERFAGTAQRDPRCGRTLRRCAGSAAVPPVGTSFVATLPASVAGYPAPGQPSNMIVPGSWYGYPSVLPVIATEPGWLDVAAGPATQRVDDLGAAESGGALDDAVRDRRGSRDHASLGLRVRQRVPRLPRRYRCTRRPHAHGELLHGHEGAPARPGIRALRPRDLRPLRHHHGLGGFGATPSSPFTGPSPRAPTSRSGRRVRRSRTAASDCTTPTWPNSPGSRPVTPINIVASLDRQPSVRVSSAAPCRRGRPGPV